jgi:hypothetical protein
MKKIFIVLGLMVGCATAFGIVYSQLLTEEDIEFQENENAQGVAMSSLDESEWPWESYNQWQCFDVSSISYERAEVCIFAANMPDVDMDDGGDKPQSLWYINRIKGAGGYWNLFEESLEFTD